MFARGGGGEEQEGCEAASSTALETAKWIEVQDSHKKQLIIEDDFAWKLPIPRTTCHEIEEEIEEEAGAACQLKYIGGVDISYSKEDPSFACATLVVLELHTLQLVYQDHALVKLNVPYVPSFLAFREAPILLHLLHKMKTNSNPFYPQVLMVDGNGLLHPRGFGLSCHIGVLAQLPTIGIGKNLHNVDGLTQFRVRHLLQAKENEGEDSVALVGASGHLWGVAMRSTSGSGKPIFVSVGHRVSLDTATKIARMTCKYRVPEPIRQADIQSRAHLRMHETRMLKQCSCLNLDTLPDAWRDRSLQYRSEVGNVRGKKPAAISYSD